MPAKYLNLLDSVFVAMRGFCVMTRQTLFQLFQLCPMALIQHILHGLLHHTEDDLLTEEYRTVAVGTSEKKRNLKYYEVSFIFAVRDLERLHHLIAQ